MEQFGGKITPELKTQYERSAHWKEGTFQNLVATTMNIGFGDIPGLLYKQFFQRQGREPKSPIPIIPFDKDAFLSAEQTQVIWYGHSVILMRINQKTILIDPMLGPDASPIAPFKTKRFSDHTLDLIDQLPEIDLLLMTHDHYDHLDLASMKKLKSKVQQYFVGLGVKRHLTRWGIEDQKVTEFDWWDDQPLDDLNITYTPTRHFSGRGLTDRAKSLWGGWVFQSPTEKVYFSGDGGYGNHFKEVGKRLGPFDFGIMECGQYNQLWHQIHLFPEESIQAAIDAQVTRSMAVHWGGFALALHHWKDPIERFISQAKASGHEVLTPQVGEMFCYKNLQSSNWWENHL